MFAAFPHAPMTPLLVFAVVLLAAVLLSEYASRTVVSTSVLFLGAGYLTGPDALGLMEVDAEGPFLEHLAEVALFSVLFTDGMQAGVRQIRRAWRLPGRALLLGLPLTFLFIMLLGRGLAGLEWTQAMLVGAALSPTDPVFASAMWGGEIDWREWIAAAWFGPKGFASVVYAILILKSGLDGAEGLFQLGRGHRALHRGPPPDGRAAGALVAPPQ